MPAVRANFMGLLTEHRQVRVVGSSERRNLPRVKRLPATGTSLGPASLQQAERRRTLAPESWHRVDVPRPKPLVCPTVCVCVCIILGLL